MSEPWCQKTASRPSAFRARVVGVQRSAVAQLQIGLHHAQPPVSG